VLPALVDHLDPDRSEGLEEATFDAFLAAHGWSLASLSARFRGGR
jgi:hypothetical protein